MLDHFCWINHFLTQYFDRKSTKPVIFVCFMNEWPDSKIILTTRDRMWKFVFSVEYFRARVKPQLLIVKINNIQIISSCSVFIRVIVRELPSDSPLEIFFWNQALKCIVLKLYSVTVMLVTSLCW